jgi:alkanesulfonate monooxygenase SsuD/methylene tetrahydromethanopterin reductase-like flavin-dependent oxidoreductase (luciferase family)
MHRGAQGIVHVDTLAARYDGPMEGFGGLFGDPEELQRRMAEFAEQMQAQQGLVWADNAIKLAVEMTVAAINRVNIQGTPEQQAEQIRAVMATVFPDAVALVREARSGFQ